MMTRRTLVHATAFALSTLALAAAGALYEVNRQTVEDGRAAGSVSAILVPVDNQHDAREAAHLVGRPQVAGVETYRADLPFEADGQRYAAGTFVIPMAQVFARYAKDLLERQTYPELRRSPNAPPEPPYDVTARIALKTPRITMYQPWTGGSMDEGWTQVGAGAIRVRCDGHSQQRYQSRQAPAELRRRRHRGPGCSRHPRRLRRADHPAGIPGVVASAMPESTGSGFSSPKAAR